MSVEHVQTKHEIEQLLTGAGSHPRKRFGQHFLIDGNLMRRLVESAEIEPGDVVLEVGGGTGGLTDLLVGRAARVVCVEIDRDLQSLLMHRFASVGGFTLICDDVLETKHRIRAEVAEAIGRRGDDATGVVKLVANLPYQVATPLVMNLLIGFPQVRRLCFTVQAEVGDRVAACAGGRDYGPLSIITRLLCDVDVVARIPPQAFWPRPAVQSVMVRLVVKDSPVLRGEELVEFSQLLRAVFDHRRKTLRAALAYAVDKDMRERLCQACDATRRPESFEVEEWLSLFRLVRGGGEGGA